MGSLNPPDWSAVQPQEYDAAQSMLQHSRLARSNSSKPANDYPMPDISNYGSQPTDMQLPSIGTNLPECATFTAALSAPGRMSQNAPFNSTYSNDYSPPRNISELAHLPQLQSQPRSYGPPQLIDCHRVAASADPSNFEGNRNANLGNSKVTSPTTPRVMDRSLSSKEWVESSSKGSHRPGHIKEDPENRPAWVDQKTKAGKERKRLPLACIACRRKKIRCSGEKPACKHCTRSRMPCVYKTTTRKAAPRTDYMAMLDRRLKRMEERVIKIIPKDEVSRIPSIPRAVVKPPHSTHKRNGRKRPAAETIGGQAGQIAGPRPSEKTTNPGKCQGPGPKPIVEGAEHLPSTELQEYLSEVFFDYLHGQSYYLMHKPSYMRKLRDGFHPPVLLLAVCAVAARFASHRELASEPAYLRGEQWAAPARDIVLKRFDEPNLTILMVTLILGLHEFGTCQGGRSWMFAGMATRMAHALQLHREMDQDPAGGKDRKNSELNFTDREIRRRTMWACFLMDRFTASGTDRPMLSDEEDIKIQLPIKESYFNMEIGGATEPLSGTKQKPKSMANGRSSQFQNNMGIAAYIVRIIALWGRVIKYWNWGGKDKEPCLMLPSPSSHYAQLEQEAVDLKSSLPSGLVNSQENLDHYAARKMGNQFLFLHASLNQVVLFHHRFALLATPGARVCKDLPPSFIPNAVAIAIEAANEISLMIDKAVEYHAVAPFMGYCAFMSSTVHLWVQYHGDVSLRSKAIKHISINGRYLDEMKKYWGVVQFQIDNLRDMRQRSDDASRKGKRSGTTESELSVLQFGDWFDKYPYGVLKTDPDEAGTVVKGEPKEGATVKQRSDLQSVGDFISKQSPSSKPPPAKKPRKALKPSSHDSQRPSSPQPSTLLSEPPQAHTELPMSIPDAQTPMTPSNFSTSQTIYYPSDNPFTGSVDYSTQPNTSALPQLDRQLVYGAYAGNEPSASTSASALNAMTKGMVHGGYSAVSEGAMWEATPQVDMGQQQMMMDPGAGNAPYLGEVSSAWFMPFNMHPPGMSGSYGAPS